MNSEFDKWFTEQFGPRPASPEEELELRRKEREGHSASEILAQIHAWERKRDAALKGWCALK